MRNGADVRALDDYHETPLAVAIRNATESAFEQVVRVVRALVSVGAPLDACDIVSQCCAGGGLRGV